MKSSLRKLRGFTLQRHEQRVDRHRDHSTAAKAVDEPLAAAQLYLFKKGVKSLEAVEPHVRLAAEQQHIDHQFSALEDEDYFVEDKNDDDYNDSHDGELSFDYG
ncbi:hypothetical protein ZWY2020_033099 [Hordeum vulgare]|nr:hypothetical protein ZWY2020_033099 [Hordeum vulgare]